MTANPSIRSTGTRANNVNVLAPPTVVVGDLILIEVGTSANISAVASTGFTAITAQAPGSPTGAGTYFLWKIATSADVTLSGAAGTYTLTKTGAGAINTQVAFAIQDTDPLTPIRSATGALSTAGGSTTNTAAVSLASLTAGDLLMWFVGSVGTSYQLTTLPTGTTRLLPSSNGQIHSVSLVQASSGSSISFSGIVNTGGDLPVGLIAIMALQATPITISSTAPKATSALTTVQEIAAISSTAPAATSSLSVVVSSDFILSVAPAATSSVTVDDNQAGVASTAPAATSALTVTLSVPTTITSTAPKATSSLRGGVESIIQITSTAPKATTHMVATTATPPTWQEVVRSAEYLDAAQAATRNVSARVEMVNDDELVVAAIPITGGNVSCDSTVDERWAATITLGDSDLMPSEVTDLLHPLSGLRARIWWTLELPSGLRAEVPIGTYYSSVPAATNNGTFGLTVKLLDVTSRIRRNKWGTGDVTDLGGQTVSAALRAVFTNRAPRFTVQITDTTETLPAVYEVGQVGRDPLSDILAIADAGAYVVYSDRMGGLVAEPRGAVDNTRTVLDLSVGEDCRMESIQRSLDETQLLNTVTVRSTSSEVDPPVYATVQDNDPASPLWVGNGFIYSDVIDSDSVTTEDQCRTLATVTLADRRALIESVDAVHRSRPEIDPLNLLDVNEPKTGASGVYQLASWSIDLEPGSMQRSVLSDRRVPV